MRMRIRLLCCLVFLVSARPAIAAEREFVAEGVPRLVETVGNAWSQQDGRLVGSGTDNFLYAGERFGPGDFEATMRLSIENLDASAASIVVNNSHFGFEGKGGTMFTHGAIFGSRDLGAPVVEEGKPFTAVVGRKGNELTIQIDDKTILSAPLNTKAIARIGLRPWRSTMAVSFFSGTGNLVEPPAALPHVDVFVSGQEGYHSYRIPAIVRTTKGTLLAFCEGRKNSRSDTGNIDMLVKRSTDNGQTWSKPIVIWDDGDNVCGNPCPVVDRQTGVIWMPMTWNLGSDHEKQIMDGSSQDVRQVYVTSSSDDGLHWTEPVKISDQVRKPHWRWYATGPGNAIQLTRGPHAGRLLIPANHSDHSDPTRHPYRSHVFWSDDHGKTWQLGGVAGDRTNESSVVELNDGAILLSMRSYHGKHNRAAAISRDGGATFGEVYLDDALQTPVCQGNILRYSWPDDSGGKSRILYSGPAGTGRTHLTVHLSYDEGKSWPISKLIYEGGSAYSNLIALPGEVIGVLYEKDDYRTISLVTFTLQWLDG